MKISLVVAHDANLLIGKGQVIPWHNPVERAALGNTVAKDMAFFKGLTAGKAILMGANTYYAMGRLLPNRFNIIVSTMLGDDSIDPLKGIVLGSLESAIAFAKKSYDELFVIGGGQIYKSVLPYTDNIYRTLIIKAYPVGPDDKPVYFPATEPNQWNTTLIEKFDHGVCEKAERISLPSA